MDKLKMAHDYAMQHLKNCGGKITMASLTAFAWQYADAMQAEADKSEKELKHNHLKTYADAYMNCEIQVTDPDGNCRITTRQKELDKKEWQPDWSQAPNDAKYWAMDKDHTANFFKNKPEITNGNGWDFGGVMQSNNSHNYQGNWQDSLRKRPSNI